jgi:uncharacterized protein (TIGR00255 family)
LKLDAVGENTVRLHVDLQLAEQYYKAIQILKEKLQFKDDIPLDLLVGAKDIIMAKEEVEDIEPYWQEVIPILKQSVKDMDQMKLSEGETLSRDLQQRLGRILRYLKEVKHQFPISLQAYWGRLNERVRSLLEGVELDPARFQQEIAILAERFDITEEVVRAESHLNQFETLLTSEEPVGRKMDFLLQEIHREMNTISSKANDAKISQAMVEIKSELEKIREQVQNIE